MTDEELNARFAQMADAIGRIADATSQESTRLEAAVERVADASSHGIQRLEAAQFRFQEQLGDIVRAFREQAEQHDRAIAENQQQIQELRLRQAESDERFEILLQEIRFLIRRQHPPQEDAG